MRSFQEEVVRPLMLQRRQLPRTGSGKWAPAFYVVNRDHGFSANIIFFDIAGELQRTPQSLMQSGAHFGACHAVIHAFDSTLLLSDERLDAYSQELGLTYPQASQTTPLDPLDVGEAPVFVDLENTNEPIPFDSDDDPRGTGRGLADEARVHGSDAEPDGASASEPVTRQVLISEHRDTLELVADAIYRVDSEGRDPRGPRSVGQPLLVAMTKADRFAPRMPASQVAALTRGGVLQVNGLAERTDFALCALVDHGARSFYRSIVSRFDRVSCHFVSATNGDALVDELGQGSFAEEPDTAALGELLATLMLRLGVIPPMSRALVGQPSMEA
jgi:hypothetical protein